jgi:ribosomal protein S18 acetylase RimI-like enzyme
MQADPEIVRAELADARWVEKLFASYSCYFGENSARRQWYRYWLNKNPREHWLVIRQVAFVHYMIRADGYRTVYEIAVSESAKRKGYGKALMARVGRPVRLKTDSENEQSNRFYKSIGMLRTATIPTRDGKKNLHVYEG